MPTQAHHVDAARCLTSRGPPIEASIYQIMREASLLFCLPKNP